MSLPSIVSYGAAAKTSSLVWDGDLVIPDGYAIESASGEVGIVGDMSVSGSLSADNAVNGDVKVSSALVTATNANLSTLTVSGYTPKLVQSTGNVISYSGAPNVTVICATVPSGGVKCNGSAAVTMNAWGTSNTITVYAKCNSLGGKISNVVLGQIYKPESENVTIPISNALIPENTQFITGFYVTASKNTPILQSVNITSSAYVSKQLI